MTIKGRLSRIGLCVPPADPFWGCVAQFIADRLGPSLAPIESSPAPWGLSAEHQAHVLEEVLAGEVDALICDGLPVGLVGQLLDRGVPTICLDELDMEHRLLCTPLGWSQAGALAGRHLGSRLGGRGRILCVAGEGGASRLGGFREALRKWPQLQVEHLLTSPSRDQAFPLIVEELRRMALPPDGILGLSDPLALAARDAFCHLNPKDPLPLIAGINADPLALAAVAEGTMAATVDVPVENLAGQAARLAFLAAAGRPFPRHFRFRPELVTSENVTGVAVRKLIAVAALPPRLAGANQVAEKRLLTQLDTTTEISRRVGAGLDLGELICQIARLIQSSFAFDVVQVLTWSRTRNRLIVEYPAPTGGAGREVPLEEAGPLADAWGRQQAVVISDTPRSRRYRADPLWPETRARIILPIRSGGRLLGLLDLHRRQPGSEAPLSVLGLQALADQLGVAMQNAELSADALQARADAEQAVAARTRLLANVSHELRAPLNVILGYTKMALTQPSPYRAELSPDLRADLGHVYRSGEHLMLLINDLLDLSRAEIGVLDIFPEAVAPRELLEEVFESMADRFAGTRQVAWELRLPERLPIIQADPVRLRHALLNLLGNARKFTEEGRIVLGAQVEPPHLHIWVQDTGPGIPPEQQEAIFQPFVTIERAARHPAGIGLELTITRRLVALHGGTMALESVPGQGSTFHVFLPLPSLAGQAVFAPSAGVRHTLLLLSSDQRTSPAISAMSKAVGLAIRRLQADDDLDAICRETQPAMLAWDMADARAGDWTLIGRLRSHPQLCRLPFMAFSREAAGTEDALGLTDVFTKPMSGSTLMDALAALRPVDRASRILIVDDDTEARELYARLARQALPDHPILLAESGAAALAILERATPGLVVLDLTLPDMDGFALLERLRTDRRTRQVPVLVVSGKILSSEDIRRLDYAHVIFQSKEMLSDEEVIACLRRVLVGSEALPQPTSALVKRALGYIHANFGRHMSRAEMAEAMGVSPSYLSRIFRQEVGLSPWEWLTRFRIQTAKELLCGARESITEVAARTSFEDPAYFSRVFHQKVGCSPRAYRKKASRLGGGN